MASHQTLTAIGLDEGALRAGLDRVAAARPWPDDALDAFGALIRDGDDRDLLRINPLAFGASAGLSETVAADLLLHGAAAGLLLMDWSMVCPYCGRIHISLRRLSHVHGGFRCDYCQVDHTTVLDDFIELSFTVSPMVRSIRYHAPERLDADDYLFVFRTSRNALTLDGRPWAEMLRRITPVVARVAPGETHRVACRLTPGMLQGSDVEGTAEFRIDPLDATQGGPRTVDLVLDDGAFIPSAGSVPAGDVELAIHNRGDRPSLVALHNLPAGMSVMSTRIGPFLSGKAALTSQTFRDLFGGEVVRTADGLQVRSVALLFTDIKGSTALYDRIGDLSAFSLVQRHFEVLRGVVAANGGAIVKTIGDAVMASFAEARQAVAAALAMRRAIAAFNAGKGDRGLVLKIGVHVGPAIAVTLNDRLDWFGQTVNIAARVQGLSGAGEVCVTEDVVDADGVTGLLAGMPITDRIEQLRGVTAGVRVHRIAAGPTG